jgi:hypothetical protein
MPMHELHKLAATDIDGQLFQRIKIRCRAQEKDGSTRESRHRK